MVAANEVRVFEYSEGRRKRQRESRYAPPPVLDAPPRWETGLPLGIIQVGDRVFIRKPWVLGPYVGIAEVTFVEPAAEPNCAAVGLRTLIPLSRFVSRGLSEDEQVAMHAFLRTQPPGRFAAITDEEAAFVYRYAAQANLAVLRLEWFVAPVSTSAIRADMEAHGGTGAFSPTSIVDARLSIVRSVVQRQGQGDFRRALLHAYGGRCTISGCSIEAVLEAAHIIPYRGPETNHVQNGLLLRADLHTLFDLDLLWIDPDTLSVLVAPLLAPNASGPRNG
jgi:hypothetical protein